MEYRLMNKSISGVGQCAQLLHERGIANVEDFLDPSPANVNRPENLDNIDAGAELLIQNLSKKILIVVDCDCDGYTSSAIMYQYIKDLNPSANIETAIHDAKQHGLEDIINDIVDSNETPFDLIIEPDAGSNDQEYHKVLAELGTKILVIDHHIPDAIDELPSNVTLINNQSSANYTNKDLTGAGVVFQFCRYLDKKLGVSYSEKYMDLCALGIIADMGSVLNLENRYFIKNGLKKPNNMFLRMLLSSQKYSIGEAVTAMGISFDVAPLINAVIRVGSLSEKKDLFVAFIDKKMAGKVIVKCSSLKSKQNAMLDKIEPIIEWQIKKEELLDHKILFIRLDPSVSASIPNTLRGLLAMRLSKKFNRPTIVTNIDENWFNRGSIRGIDSPSMPNFKLFLENSGLFEYVLGHPNSAGCSISEKNFDNFIEYADAELAEVDFNNEIVLVNFVKKNSSLDVESLIYDIDKYKECWGQKNPQPLIYVGPIEVPRGNISVIGKLKNTIRFSHNGVTYIKFSADKMIKEFQELPGNKVIVELVGTGQINNFNGNTSPQIVIDKYEFLSSHPVGF